MSLSPVYVGIDVACAAGKRLPICVVSGRCPLTPVVIPKHLNSLLPRGIGNKEITAVAPFREAASAVVSAINNIASEMRLRIERIAIDAPAAPPLDGVRSSEQDLARQRLSSFQTPSVSSWTAIVQKCANHLRSGGALGNLPYANKIWMLFGFELFASLKRNFSGEALEVYPFAIVRALLPDCEHKSTELGYRRQLIAVAARTGWKLEDLHTSLKIAVPGSRHDRLDAFMAAWVASLPPERRRAFGDPCKSEDAIWVPL